MADIAAESESASAVGTLRAIAAELQPTMAAVMRAAASTAAAQ
jgi:hypothetical protein